MIARLEHELMRLAGDLRRSATEHTIKQTIKRLENMATAIARDGMVLVLPKTIQGRKSGTPYVTGDMVYLQRQEGGATS